MFGAASYRAQEREIAVTVILNSSQLTKPWQFCFVRGEETDRQKEIQREGVSHETLFILSDNAAYNLRVLLKCCFSMDSVVGSSSTDRLESVLL